MKRVKHWQTWEDTYITNHWGRMTQIEMAVRLGCSRDQVKTRLYQLKAVKGSYTEPPKAWQKSYVELHNDPELVLAVDVQKILVGTYR
jgi:hypothetical protein